MITFDPHPAGCPVGLRVGPHEMPELVGTLYLKLRDVLHAGVFVVNPSKGDSYPILFLSGLAGERVPRVALFPAWEDRKGARKLDFARQTSLLHRIREAGIVPEPLDSYHGVPSERLPGPLYLPLDTRPEGMEQVLHDLFERLGAHLRMTVVRPGRRPGDRRPTEWTLVRVYVLDDEVSPRLVLFPGWDAGGAPVTPEEATAMDAAARESRVAELPIEALFGG